MAPTRASFSPSTLAAENPRLRLPVSTGPPSEDNPPREKVWLIFGATEYIGRPLVTTALSYGDKVTAVGQLGANTMEQMQGWHENCLGQLCDVRIRSSVEAVIKASFTHWGRVDIVVNCTGYGVVAACEDQDDYDLRSQFETNFFGTLNIIQLSLPLLREQSSKRKDKAEIGGRYIIFSSIGGTLGIPGVGPFCATKYAIEGLVESMLYEIDAFGLKASLVEPGYLRSPNESVGPDGRPHDEENSAKLPRYSHYLFKPPSEPYNTPTHPAGHAGRLAQWLSRRQAVSLVKAMELTWQLGHCRFPPLRLFLGSMAVESVRDRLRSVTEEMEDWKHLHFPQPGESGPEPNAASAMYHDPDAAMDDGEDEEDEEEG